MLFRSLFEEATTAQKLLSVINNSLKDKHRRRSYRNLKLNEKLNRLKVTVNTRSEIVVDRLGVVSDLRTNVNSKLTSAEMSSLKALLMKPGRVGTR